MLNGGELQRQAAAQEPAPSTMMRTNVLNDQTLNSKSGIGPVHLQPGLGFGYDFAVMRDPAALKSPLGKGSYWWWGIAGHLVLERSDQRSPVHRHDPAPRRRARRGEPRGSRARDHLQGAGRSGQVAIYTFTPSLVYHGVVMALNLKNAAVERLAAEVARLTGESKTEAIRRALDERRRRLKGPSHRPAARARPAISRKEGVADAARRASGAAG